MNLIKLLLIEFCQKTSINLTETMAPQFKGSTFIVLSVWFL